MNTTRIITEYKTLIYPDDLTSDDKALLDAATKMLDFAYAPYSGFHVGAALRLNNGEIFPGCNQENASYPLCMCGERVALYNAAANRPNHPVHTLAIVVRNPGNPVESPASPCGACRQVITEYETKYGQPIRLLLKAESNIVYALPSGASLLPLGFNNSYL